MVGSFAFLQWQLGFSYCCCLPFKVKIFRVCLKNIQKNTEALGWQKIPFFVLRDDFEEQSHHTECSKQCWLYILFILYHARNWYNIFLTKIWYKLCFVIFKAGKDTHFTAQAWAQDLKSELRTNRMAPRQGFGDTSMVDRLRWFGHLGRGTQRLELAARRQMVGSRRETKGKQK